MTYYIYHIPGKKIGVTRDLKYRVEEQQGYEPNEYDVIMKSDNIDYTLDSSHSYILDYEDVSAGYEKSIADEVNRNL